MGNIERVVQQLKNATEKHESDGTGQWYVDDLSIDCDAEEFWKVIEETLREVL